jgi:TetR/AcrR family transcriptional regulator, regulator of autoinduction and epiphytic fitness
MSPSISDLSSEKTRELSPEKTRRILDGAMKEFLDKGYAGASMDRVATAAGVSKATVYSHFQDKETLFIQLVEQLATHHFQSAVSSLDLNDEPAKILPKLAQIILTECFEAEYLAFKRTLIGESGRFPELAKTFVRHLVKPAIAMMTEYLTSRTELQIDDPEATARIVISSLVHYSMQQEMMHGKEIVPRESDRLVTALIKLLTRS